MSQLVNSPAELCSLKINSNYVFWNHAKSGSSTFDHSQDSFDFVDIATWLLHLMSLSVLASAWAKSLLLHQTHFSEVTPTLASSFVKCCLVVFRVKSVGTVWPTYGQKALYDFATYLNFFFSFSLFCSPLLGRRSSDQPLRGSDLLSPNLRPRHQELIPTPCGPVSSSFASSLCEIMLLFKWFINKVNLKINALLVLLLCFYSPPWVSDIVDIASGLWKTSLLCLPDKTLVRAVISGPALLLLHRSVTASAAGPHHIQHLQGAQKYGHLWWRQLHSVSHPVDRNMWVHHTSLAASAGCWCDAGQEIDICGGEKKSCDFDWVCEHG